MKISAIQSVNSLQNQQQVRFGRTIAGEEFSDAVISEAEGILKSNQRVDAGKYKQDFFECLEDAKVQPLEWLFMPVVRLLQFANGEHAPYNTAELTRFTLGIGTIGISELLKMPEAAIRKLISNKKANDFASHVEKCALAMIRENKLKNIVKI